MNETLCGWCLDPIPPGTEAVCPVCGAAHHLPCWETAGLCSTTGCPGTLTPRPVEPIEWGPTAWDEPLRPANVFDPPGEEELPWTPSTPQGIPSSPGFHWGAALLGPVWAFGHGMGTGLWVTAVFAALYGFGGFGAGWLAHLVLGAVGWEVGWREHLASGAAPGAYAARERAWTITSIWIAAAAALVLLLYP